jgi:PPOX class probable F420-dependent enzyme
LVFDIYCRINCFTIVLIYTGYQLYKKGSYRYDLKQALTASHLAHLVTLNRDGSPQVSIVWVGLDGDEIVCGQMTTHLYQKLKNIQRDARVALSMVTGGKTDGLDNYPAINGSARITEGGAPELVNQLAQIYIQPSLLMERHRDMLPILLLKVFMVMDHGLRNEDSCL